MRIAIGPSEDEAKLVVNPNRVKSGPTSFQGLESVAGWKSEIRQHPRSVESIKSEQRRPPDGPGNATRCLGLVPLEKVFRAFVRETDDHTKIYCFNGICANRDSPRQPA